MLGANSHKISVPSYKRKTPTPSRPIRRLSLTAPDGSKACYDCGYTDHVCGDNSCATPGWSTRQRRKIKGSASTESNPFFTRSTAISLLAVTDHDTRKAYLLTPVYWNLIIDNGCLKSAGCLENVISLSITLGIPFHLSALDCATFYHGYGEACSDARLTICICNLLLVDLNDVEFRILF
jgi:hypothetical protein